MRIGANRSRDCKELGNVQSPLAEFELGHECLALPETLPKFYLRDACVLPSLHEQFDHSLIEIRSK